MDVIGDEPQLLARIGNGDEKALGDLYDRYSRLIYSMVLRITHSESETTEIVQDVFLTVWRSATSFDAERAKISTWLTTVARNKAIDRHRTLQRRLPEGERTPSLAHSNQGTIEAARLSSMVGELSSNQCHAIQLAFFEGLTHLEMADRSGETPKTVKSHIRLGMEKLRQKAKGGE